MTETSHFSPQDEVRLRESEARKAAILETALDAIITIDQAGNIVEFNPAAERIFGYRRSQVLGQAMADLIVPPALRAAHHRGLARYLATGESPVLNQRIEMPALRADGTEFFAELAITRIAPSRQVLFTAYLRDITDRRRQDDRRAVRVAINQILMESSSLKEAAPRILQAVCDNLHWDVGALWLVDHDHNRLTCLDVWHRATVAVPAFEAITRKRSFAPGEGLPGRVWTSGAPLWIPDVVMDDNFPRAPIAAKEQLHGAFGLPILLGKEVLGVIEFFSHQIREPDAEKLEMAGTMGGQIGQFIDRERADAAVRFVTQQLQIVTESMAALVTRCSRDLRYLWVSKPYAEWLGRTTDEIVGRPICDVIGDQAFDQLKPHFEKVLAGAKVQYESEVNFGPLGLRWINAVYTPTFDNSDIPNGWVAVVVDITERREIEFALRQSEQRFSRFMEQLPGLAWIKDLEGRYVYANAAAMTIFGHSADSLYGKTDAELFPAETAAMFIENDRRAIASEAGLQLVETMQHQDGTVHHSLVSKFPIRNPKGGHLLVGGMAIDITDRLRAEESLQEANRRKNDFLATLAHELRNPLAPLRTGLELLRLAEGNTSVIDQTRNMMERQLGHMVRLIDDLLDVSRITRGRLALRREPVELGPVVRDAIDTSRPLFDALGHTFTASLPTDSIFLDADRTRLTQVFSNLLNNAAKYTNPGGQISLTARPLDGEVQIVVRDSGIGIAANHLPHIFESFSQLIPTLERSQGGLGVGLGLARALVELHGGTIEARSGGLGAGSEFSVRLPMLLDPIRPRRQDDTEPGLSKITPRRILVVDDNRDAAISLVMMLRMSGHDVDVAYDGFEAIQAAATFLPDVVLLDIGMPKTNGYDVARHIRKQPWGSSIILVALTGWGQEEDKQRAMEAGFNHHLTKPVISAALKELLANVETA